MTSTVACITGGTSGIGRALTKNLLSGGWTVVAVGKSTSHADGLSAEVQADQGKNVLVRQADLRSWEACQEIAKEIDDEYGRLHLLVNAAGTISSGGVHEESPSRWQEVLDTNLTATFNVTKSCLGLLKSTPGASIVNISSVCSLQPCSSISYSVSKAGTDMFTRTLARELAPDGVRVNSVNPGVVRSNLQFSAGLFKDESSYEAWIDQMMPAHPLGRVGEPEDIVHAVRFLASEQASWITGAILSVDGGRSVG